MQFASSSSPKIWNPDETKFLVFGLVQFIADETKQLWIEWNVLEEKLSQILRSVSDVTHGFTHMQSSASVPNLKCSLSIHFSRTRLAAK